MQLNTVSFQKNQVDKIYELPDEDYEAVFKTVKKVAKRMEEVLGRRTLMKIVGTEVPHAHVHLTPYDETWVHGRIVKLTEDEMKDIQEKLKF